MKNRCNHIMLALDSLFQLETTRHGRYTYPEVQKLKEMTESYTQNPSNAQFNMLKKALRDSLTFIEKWHLNFDSIKIAMDNEAQFHGLAPINWPKLLANSKVSDRFQHSILHHPMHDEDLLVWLTALDKRPFAPLDDNGITQLLVDNQKEAGFSKKLSAHLQKEPLFLFHLALKSERNFLKIAHTSMVLYLTDEQLAQIIMNHLPKPATTQEKVIGQVDALVSKLNHTLSYGRSISTLLRNANAKAILSTSIFFRIYLSQEYAAGAFEEIQPIFYTHGHGIKANMKNVP